MSIVTHALLRAAAILEAGLTVAGLLPDTLEVWSEPVRVPLSLLDTLDVRQGIQQGRKDHWENEYPERWPAVDVDVDAAGTLSLADGNHRLAVAREAHHDNILIRLRKIGRVDSWEIWDKARAAGVIQPPPVTQAQVDKATPAALKLITPEPKDPFTIISEAEPGEDVSQALKLLLRMPGTKTTKDLQQFVRRSTSAVIANLSPKLRQASRDAWGADFSKVPHIKLTMPKRQAGVIRVRRTKDGRVRVDFLSYDRMGLSDEDEKF